MTDEQRAAIAAWQEASDDARKPVLDWFAEETARAHRYSPSEDVPDAMSALLAMARAFSARTPAPTCGTCGGSGWIDCECDGAGGCPTGAAAPCPICATRSE